MYILLREWNFNAILVQGIVNGAQYIADNICFLCCICPHEHLEIDAGITQFTNYRPDLFRTVNPLVIQIVDRIVDKRNHLLQIAAISYAIRNNL